MPKQHNLPTQDSDQEQPSSAQTEINNSNANKQSAPRGACKFDGTDYPDWLPSNPYKKAEEPFTFPFPEVEGNPWVTAAQLVKDYDGTMCDAWVDEIHYILVFAGLFSAVVTAFAIETQKLLQTDPDITVLLAQLVTRLATNNNSTGPVSVPFHDAHTPTRSLRINALVYFSLALSLGTALVGIIVLQWIRSYRSSESQPYKTRISLRHFRYESLIHWKVPEIISALPLILQTSLVVFFVGLIDYLHSLNTTVTIIIATPICCILLFVLFTTVAPGIYELALYFNQQRYSSFKGTTPSPYQSPQSWLFLRFIIALQGAARSIYSAVSGQHKPRNFGRMKGAKNWPQLAQLHLDSESDGLPSVRNHDVHDGSAVGWIIKNFADVDSFITLFHCFQSMGDVQMRSALVTIRGAEDSDLIWNQAIPSNDFVSANLGLAERRHILSVLLLDWAAQNDLIHHDIDLHELELSLRSMTYPLPPICPDSQRLIPSRLPLWKNIIYRPRDFRSEMWLFAFLVSLRSPEFQPHLESLDPFDRRLSMLYFWLSVDHHFHQGSLGPIDDSFEVLGKWLESWLSADPDEDIEHAWQQDIVWAFVASIHERALTDQLPSDCVDLKLLIKRPTFLAVLDRFVGYAKGRRAWSCAQSSIPDVDVAEASLKGWDDFLAGTSYTEKYLALSYDKQRLEHIIRGSKPLRNTSLTPNTGIGSVYPDTNAQNKTSLLNKNTMGTPSVPDPLPMEGLIPLAPIIDVGLASPLMPPTLRRGGDLRTTDTDRHNYSAERGDIELGLGLPSRKGRGSNSPPESD